MNFHYLLAALGATAVAAVAALPAVSSPPQPARAKATAPAFDPLFAGAQCAPVRAGRPPLLDTLLLAQAETTPFKPGQQRPAPPSETAPPLYTNLGALHVQVTTGVPKAQAYFDQGLRLTFAFNHAEAGRAFRAARQLDPDCAMCHWGEALVLGPNINAPMFPEAAAPAHAAAGRALALAGKTTPAEQALIRAVAKRYAADPPADRAPLDKAYAEAMAEAARSFPNNDTIQVLYAESLMDLAPWDYWEAGGARPKPDSVAMLAALERVLERNPSHPGAAHYYIHAVEASTHPERALPSAQVLARQIPGAGHIVHMPSHIYYRLGMYRKALQSNIDAIATDERYFGGSPSDPVYKGAYYPHNIHFVMVSALMGGRGDVALDAANKLDKAVPAELLKGFAGLQPVKSAPYFSHVQFSPPDVLLALPDPGPDFVLVKAMWHYARGRLCAQGLAERRPARSRGARPHRADRRFHPDRRLGRAGARDRADGARRRPRAAAGRRRRPAGCGGRLPRSDRVAGQAAVHGTALLVLSGAPVARRGAAAQRPAGRRRTGVPRLAGAHAEQWLGAARPGRGLPPARRCRGAGGGAEALRDHLAGRTRRAGPGAAVIAGFVGWAVLRPRVQITRAFTRIVRFRID
ncbi:hypothetical protein LQ564_13115 [Massilia sp. G4R7]|uniref:Cytochrome c domain-containing protein n=1 Tax=Massilia phyllostachyos TaxID=2898585 RepID=A0ABS8Q6T1_9BURK|nr:hypothetical protein [Massilia phyllostachyos]MCD2517248.1 hypothetical protein [Massilia phyllostachyos]